MKLYQAFATDLNHLLNDARAVRITVPGYMPLSVEEIGIQWRRIPAGVPLSLRRTERRPHARSRSRVSCFTDL
jgi:hypothetical protein